MTIIDLIQHISDENGAEALSALCVEAKTQQGRDEIDRLLSEEVLEAAAKDQSPKKRKNAYRLMGLLKNKKYLPSLQEALKKETTLFTIPSIILSLGVLQDFDTIKNYIPPASENEAMDKHVAEIVIARKKALQALSKEDRPAFCKLDRPKTILCMGPEGFNAVLAEELRELGFAVVQDKNCCRICTSDLTQLFKTKVLVEALIPIATNVRLDAESISKALSRMPDEPYRIELRGYTRDRRKLINSLSSILEGDNNPSSYAWELRVECRQEVADLYWKPFRNDDHRYVWRKQVLPASMHPALAAGVAAYANKLVRVSNPTVLDPFCGSGSLLFSIESEMKCQSLMGVDKSSTAVQYARENALAGNSKAFFITKDILRFEAKNSFDLILSNMPFGMRVGNHDINKELYSKFCHKIPRLLSEKGIAVLYTMEYRLLQSCINETPGIRFREKLRTQAGGLLPWIFVIDKE